jgi:hypothetical protein
MSDAKARTRLRKLRDEVAALVGSGGQTDPAPLYADLRAIMGGGRAHRDDTTGFDEPLIRVLGWNIKRHMFDNFRILHDCKKPDRAQFLELDDGGNSGVMTVLWMEETLFPDWLNESATSWKTECSIDARLLSGEEVYLLRLMAEKIWSRNMASDGWASCHLRTNIDQCRHVSVQPRIYVEDRPNYAALAAKQNAYALTIADVFRKEVPHLVASAPRIMAIFDKLKY